MTIVRCVFASVYSEGLTRGADYPLLDHDAGKAQVRIKDDRGRLRWYPATCFDLGQAGPSLISFVLDDPIQDTRQDCVEVTVELSDGQRRWCFFVTVQWLLAAMMGTIEPKQVDRHGLLLGQITYLAHPLTADDGTPFSIVGIPHMIVVSQLSRAIIAEALAHLDGRGELAACTRALA